MQVFTERPLLDKEIKILKLTLKQLDKKRSVHMKFLIGWTLLVAVIATLAWFMIALNDRSNLLFVAVIYILIGFWSFTEAYLKQFRIRKDIGFAFASNKGSYIKVTATEYIEISETDDEGVFYLFQIAENKILLFGGQDFYPTQKFPSDDFEIVICYGQKRRIVLSEVYVLGNKIYPKIKITGEKRLAYIQHLNYPEPGKFTIINDRLSNIEKVISG